MGSFVEYYPSIDSYWRSIILFGRNVASYKFALGHSLLLLAKEEKSFVTLEELSKPFSKVLAKHVMVVDKQGTSPKSKFLDAVRSYNRGEINKEQLELETVRRGFQNVIDAFHFVGSSNVPVQFFIDERSKRKGIQITDDLYKLLETSQAENLSQEVEARWCLVERAWELNISKSLIQVDYDHVGRSIRWCI